MVPVFVMALIAGAVLLPGIPAQAGTYRFTAPDGTVHYTNAPADPRYGSKAPSVVLPLQAPAVTVPPAPGFAGVIRRAAERYGIPEKVISAVIRVESGFNPRAVSRKGAQGLMQLMPSTAALLGVRNVFDPAENIDGGVRHLSGLLYRFSNDLPLALAAYNAGEQAVLSYRGVPPYPETLDYIDRILRLLQDGRKHALTGPFGAPAGAPAPPSVTYRLTRPDGTVVYTNIPPRGTD